MKKIYNNIFKISIPIFMLIILSGCSNLTYKQDKIYTEDTLPAYAKNDIKENKKSNIGREDAIEKALKVLNEGFKENLDRESLYESISLVNTGDSNFYWDINFMEKQNEQKNNNFYYIGVDAEHGDILEVIINKYKKEETNTVEHEVLMTEEIKLIIRTLTSVLNINLDDYEIFINEDNIELIDPKNKIVKHVFEVDRNSKKITRYYKVRY